MRIKLWKDQDNILHACGCNFVTIVMQTLVWSEALFSASDFCGSVVRHGTVDGWRAFILTRAKDVRSFETSKGTRQTIIFINSKIFGFISARVLLTRVSLVICEVKDL